VASAFDLAAKIVEWALTLYLWMMIIAILLTWVTPDPRNPIVSFLNRMTAPLWGWVQGVLPGRWRAFSAYGAVLLLLFLVECLPGSIRTLGAFFAGQLPPEGVPVPIAGYFLRGAAVVLYNVLFFIVLALAVWFVLTLVNPAVNNPIVRTVYFLVDPIITPLQKRLPRGRIDFSPVIAAVALLLVNWFLVGALMGISTEMIHTGAPPATLPSTRM
jgi:YggT family protein